MARVLVLGGGFAGVVAAESLAKKLGPQHQITLVSRRREFLFYPALVRLAFGHCKVEDISYDLRTAMLDRRIEFIEAQVARPNPDERLVITAHGEVEGKMPYDYLVFALGRRLATENVAGFFEHAHHLLTVNAALKFGEALKQFNRGHAVIGYCVDARLAIPVYETAFALDRMLIERGDRDNVKITVVSPDQMNGLLGGSEVAERVKKTLAEHNIEVVQDFVVNRVTENQITAADGRELNHDNRVTENQ
ncbi:MAG TPA: FAD-dependent oxidoreductase, partial [Blastocatellia bacterium]|nr:FAD-dependent oxidoreductase [Blastocatellia bacterium]